jgi:hypothetical protein
MDTEERKDAFCCYNRDDDDDITFVLNELETRGGISTHRDFEVEPGQNWMDRLQKMIVASETFLLFLRTKPTEWQLRELNFAIQLQTSTGKPYIIPVLLPNLQDGAFFHNPNLSFIQNSSLMCRKSA